MKTLYLFLAAGSATCAAMANNTILERNPIRHLREATMSMPNTEGVPKPEEDNMSMPNEANEFYDSLEEFPICTKKGLVWATKFEFFLYKFSGLDECTETSQCTDIDCSMDGSCVYPPSASTPCLNGAQCLSGEEYFCRCPPGFEGDNCETNIDDCAQDPCNGQGTCTDGIASSTCACNPGYGGDNCGIDLCDETCTGVGVDGCDRSAGDATCTCEDGWTGIACDIDLCDTCVDNNIFSCSRSMGSATCQCKVGWEGEGCGFNFCQGLISGGCSPLDNYILVGDGICNDDGASSSSNGNTHPGVRLSNGVTDLCGCALFCNDLPDSSDLVGFDYAPDFAQCFCRFANGSFSEGPGLTCDDMLPGVDCAIDARTGEGAILGSTGSTFGGTVCYSSLLYSGD